MISAAEAKRKALLNTDLKSELSMIEERIEEAISYGLMTATISIGNGYEDDKKDAIIKELELLGYDVEYCPPKPLPSGCPSDQWVFDAYLELSWKGEKK